MSSPNEEGIRRALVLQALFNGATRLLGQVSGLLLLANAGSDLERQRVHLRVARLQWLELNDACHGLDRSKTVGGVVQSAARLGALLGRLERRFALSLRDNVELRTMLDELAAIRRLLQESSCPAHGLALVDFAGACCAGAH